MFIRVGLEGQCDFKVELEAMTLVVFEVIGGVTDLVGGKVS